MILLNVTKDILPDQKLDCVAYGCTSGTIAAGYNSIFEKVNAAKPNTKVTTPITAAIKALKKLKV
jgi:maleate isomerase